MVSGIVRVKVKREIAKEIAMDIYPTTIFNLRIIPIEALDDLWLPMSSFNVGLPHRHAFRLVGKSADFKGDVVKAKEIITSTYPVDPRFFQIHEGPNGKYAALLMSLDVENIKVMEEAMQKLGFDRVNPTGNQALEDVKGRQYITIKFEAAPVK